MNRTHTEAFEMFFQESFALEKTYRELRLSVDEVEYIRNKYPGAAITRSSSREDLDGKAWYEINLTPFDEEYEDQNKKKVILLEKENLLLKRQIAHYRIPAEISRKK
ncbi:hypothetical protein [Fredinandcohnia sp. 179-A 10B2 NHS]|uniref:hypothetical protein n=1 Tax=Fredinandcohnia sp. 179-A 10B2 NHS TaxID=3235176 RepID=UPI0039A09320